MKWSWRIARITGIDVYVHVTFLVLIAFLVLTPVLSGQPASKALGQLVFTCLLFGIVVLHELGHALAARKYGIRTRDIILLPIGGVARLERMPEEPKQELLVALAGPAVNVALGLVLLGALIGLGSISEIRHASPWGGHLLATLISVNVLLALFNLIPAFPMDGGRVLRALLAMRIDYVRATQIAAFVGQGLAIAMGLYGVLNNDVMLMFIAFFVWMGASDEAAMVQVKSVLGGIPIGRAMITEFHVLDPGDPLEKAVSFVLGGFQHDFPVADANGLVGVLTRADLMTALASEGLQGRVENVMRREFETADPGEMLEGVFERLQACDCRSLPIVRDRQVLGIVTLENIGEFMMVQSALRDGRKPA